MIWPMMLACILLSLVEAIPLSGAEPRSRGFATAETKRPVTFPHRIWAACDFEGPTADYGWFGRSETNNLPRYPGNRAALRARKGPYENVGAVMAGINPVPGPRMGKENGLFLRYFLQGGSKATFQHFSLTREDNWHIVVDGLAQGRWDEVALDFTRDARRNDGSRDPFGDGERMDDFKLFAGKPDEAANYELLIDDVIFFANDPALPPEPEPFPNRIVLLAAFDTGPKERYWPGDFELVENAPDGGNWRAAKSVPHQVGKGQFIRIAIEPPRPVGAHTKLRFRYNLTGASAFTVQIFDATVQDNRHIRVKDLKPEEWTTLYLDFSRDSRRNDGTPNSPLTAGNLVDDLFFFVEGGGEAASLFVDEVVLFDAAATDTPYPPSPMIKEIVWAPTNTIVRKAPDGDNWPVTWANDDALYTTWGDGTGFAPKVEKKLSCGFARITGLPPDFMAENVRSPAEQLGQGRAGMKGWGILAVGDVLYLWLGHADKKGGQARLAWSQDGARTWTFAHWIFAEFGSLGFVNYGRGYQGARDAFVYAYSHDSPQADTPADRFILLRAPKDQLAHRAAWEFFTGLEASRRPLWSRDIAARRGVFLNRDGCLRSAMTYNAGLHRYLWWQQIPQPSGRPDRGDTRFEGGFAIYDAPEPWGPWTTAFYSSKWDIGPGEHGDFPAKWMSHDGHSAWLVFSGADAFSVRHAKFIVSGERAHFSREHE